MRLIKGEEERYWKTRHVFQLLSDIIRRYVKHEPGGNEYLIEATSINAN